MKKRLWYIYFGISALLAIINTLAYLSEPTKYNPVLLLYVIDFLLGVTGTYAYLWKKKIFVSAFWLLFFTLNCILDMLFLIYAFAPNSPYSKMLTFLNPQGVIDSLGYTLVSTAFDIPMLYAVYNLARDRNFNQDTVTVKSSKQKKGTWNLFQTALWGYSTVFMLIILIFSFIPQTASGDGHTDVLSGAAAFLPLGIFWILVVLHYKEYRWNWWRTTLLLNSLLYTGLIFLGIFSVSTKSNTIYRGLDFISIAETGILFISLVVFGRDQEKLRSDRAI